MNLRQHIKENIRLALPVMISNLGHVMMSVCDSIMVGHVSAVSLAAAGLATVAFNVLFLFGVGVSYAITPLVASADGEGNHHRIADVLRHGLVINTLNGVLLALIVVVGKNVLYHLDQPQEVIDESIPYLSIITFSLIPILIYQSFKQFAEGLSNTRVALAVVMATNVLNIALNYIFIYGHLGLPPMGLNGAGWATLFSRVVMAVAMALYIYRATVFSKFRSAFTFGNYSAKLFRTMLQLGIPSGVQFIFEVAAFDFSLVMMGWLGTQAQAAHQIAINLATLSYMTTAGLAAAATVRVGYFLGSKDKVNVQKAAYSLLGMALVMMSVFALIFIVGRYWLPSLYVTDPNVIAIASTLMVIAGLFQLADGTQVVCASALRGMQDVKVPSLFIFVAYWIIGLPLGYWLGSMNGYGAQGIWIGLFIGLTLTALAMYMRLRYRLKNI